MILQRHKGLLLRFCLLLLLSLFTVPVARSQNVEGVGWMLEHRSDFTWTQDILVLPNAQPGLKALRFKIRLQVCDKTCINGEPGFEVSINITDAPAVPLGAALQERLKVKEQAIEEVAAPAGLPFGNPIIGNQVGGVENGKPEVKANQGANKT